MHITIAVCGFQHENWEKQFFPDNLPEDWRFDYYSNEFDSVLLSEVDLLSEKRQWLNEIMSEAADSFLFVIEVSDVFDATHAAFYKKSAILQVDFFSAEPTEVVTGVSIDVAEIICQQNVNQSTCVVRVSSVRPVSNDEIKQVLVHIYRDFTEFEQVNLFFCGSLQDIEVVNTAKIINDLL